MQSKEFKLLTVVQSITLVLVFILVVDRYHTSSSSDSNSGIALPVAQDLGTASTVSYSVDNSQSYVYGLIDAPNTMIVYSRYNCMFCREFYAKVLDSLLANPVKDGRLRIVSRQFVHPEDKTGMLMAKVVEVARQEGKYLEVHNALIKGAMITDSVEIMNRAVAAGVSEKALRTLLNDERTLNNIYNDRKAGEKLHIKSTPSIMINSTLNTGYMDYNLILDYIDL